MTLCLEKLRKENLIEEFDRKGMKYAKCIPVGEIDDILASRERELEQTRLLLSRQLPELIALESKLSITPKVRFVEGADAVNNLYGKIFKEPNFCSFFDPASIKKITPESHYQMPKFIGQVGGKARELAVNSPDALEYKQLFGSKTHEVKILPIHIKFTSDIIICKDVLYMVAYGETDVSATQIQSASLVGTLQTIFDEVWKMF